MNSRQIYIHLLSFFSGYLILLVMIAGCSAPKPSVHPSPAESLLLVTPLTDAAVSENSESLTTKRVVLNDISVECWIPPAGVKVLRFPVELRKTPRLSLRLGTKTRVSIHPSDYVIRIEYARSDVTTVNTSEPAEPVVLYEAAPLQIPESFIEWVNLDISLKGFERTRGELRFVVDGKLAGSEGLDIIWGCPVIYYPDEMRHRNILLIGVDTLRRDALGIYGGRTEVTPRIDSLAANSVIFDNAWSQAPYTGPSFASMLTGKFPSGNSPTLARLHLPAQVETIAERLLPEGFATQMVCGNPYMGTLRSGFYQGFEGLWYTPNAPPDKSVEAAKNFIDLNDNRDWFLFLHFIDPHGPYDPPESLIEKLCGRNYAGKYLESFSETRDWRITSSIPPETDVTRAHELYEAEVADVDAAVGDLFDFLNRNNLLENTLVIFAADHGEEFYEHKRYGHGQSLYDEMVHLSLMVWGDGFAPGTRMGTPVANIDIVPTILKFAEIAVPEDLPGIPLQDSILENNINTRIIFGEGNLRQSFPHKFAVEMPWKAIVNYFTGETQLYNLQDDPGETANLIAIHPEIAERLKDAMTKTMPPLLATFLVTMVGETQGGPDRFSGSIEIPGGYSSVISSGVLDHDNFREDGETIFFNFDMVTDAETPFKSLIIVPNPGSTAMTIKVIADGRPEPDRLYPYGTSVPEPSGMATVNLNDFPWPNALPPDAGRRPVAIYVIAIPGPTSLDYILENEAEFDPETREQLKALGYIN